MKGASSGLPSWVKETLSSPQPHHFIGGRVAPSRYMRGTIAPCARATTGTRRLAEAEDVRAAVARHVGQEPRVRLGPPSGTTQWPAS